MHQKILGILVSCSCVCFTWFSAVSSPIRKPSAKRSIIDKTQIDDKNSGTGVPFIKPKSKICNGARVNNTKKSCPVESGTFGLSFFFGFNHFTAPEENTLTKVASSPARNYGVGKSLVAQVSSVCLWKSLKSKKSEEWIFSAKESTKRTVYFSMWMSSLDTSKLREFKWL